MHHTDEHIMTDISDGKVFLLLENGEIKADGIRQRIKAEK